MAFASVSLSIFILLFCRVKLPKTSSDISREVGRAGAAAANGVALCAYVCLVSGDISSGDIDTPGSCDA